jgi:hypothetical protein
MNYLMVDIFDYSFDCFPGLVSCKFTDALGKVHCFNEKIPVVSSENIWKWNENTILPQKGYIAGEIISEENGIINFSTIKPWYVETNENINVFFVHENQIISEIEYTLIEKIKHVIDGIDRKVSDNSLAENERYIHSIEEARKMLVEYKNNMGTQRKAYNTVSVLYNLYNEQKLEERMDFTADVLDIIVGYNGWKYWNREYLIWEEYLEINHGKQY